MWRVYKTLDPVEFKSTKRKMMVKTMNLISRNITVTLDIRNSVCKRILTLERPVVSTYTTCFNN
jgi:hypothetical protein